jgi:hypothetical protein
MWWRSLILHTIGTVEGEAELPLFKVIEGLHLQLHSSVQFLVVCIEVFFFMKIVEFTVII